MRDPQRGRAVHRTGRFTLKHERDREETPPFAVVKSASLSIQA